jgi:protein-disulfide isomerase
MLRKGQSKVALDVVTTVAMLLASVAVGWAVIGRPKGAGEPNLKRIDTRLPGELLSLDEGKTLGSRSARVAVVIYSDFQCPYCALTARESVSTLISTQVAAGTIRLSFRHRPLVRIHPFATLAAGAAECAAHQEKFWRMHDALFEKQGQLNREVLLSQANGLGLDMGRFTTCLDGEGAARVRQEMAEADRLGITGTPTFLLGSIQADGRVRITKRVSGVLSAEQLTELIAQ